MENKNSQEVKQENLKLRELELDNIIIEEVSSNPAALRQFDQDVDN